MRNDATNVDPGVTLEGQSQEAREAAATTMMIIILIMEKTHIRMVNIVKDTRPLGMHVTSTAIEIRAHLLQIQLQAFLNMKAAIIQNLPDSHMASNITKNRLETVVRLV